LDKNTIRTHSKSSCRCRPRPATTNVSKTRSCNYSLEAPDDERQYRLKHVEQSRNNGIINCPTQLHLVGHLQRPVTTNVCKTRSCNYSLEAPDDERQYSSEHVEQSGNNGIINCPTQLHLVGHLQRPVTKNVCKTRSCNYSLEAPDDERQYHSKHVEQSRNKGIIKCPTQLHLVGHFYKLCIMMHGSMNVKYRILKHINP